MSFRTVTGILFLGVAMVTPWLVRDWLPHSGRPFPSVQDAVQSPPLVVGVPPLQQSGTRLAPLAIETPITSSSQANLQESTRPLSKPSLSLRGEPIFIRVFKEEKELELWMQRQGAREFFLCRVYPLNHSPGEIGPPSPDARDRAPEGFYYVSPSRMLPAKAGFKLGSSNGADSLRSTDADYERIIGTSASPGSYSLGQMDMEEIVALATMAYARGQKFFRVHCLPFRMDDRRLDEKLKLQPLLDSFWANLKEGYDFFEILRVPPDVRVSAQGCYLFSLP